MILNTLKELAPIFKKILDKCIKFLFGLILLIGVCITLLQIPFFQTIAVQFLSNQISKKINFPVSIGNVNIRWLDELIIEDAVLQDPRGEKMIIVGKATVDFKIMKLLRAELVLEDVTLENGGVHLVSDSSGTLNINQFIDALSSGDSSSSDVNENPAKFEVPLVTLKNMHFSYDDIMEPHIPDFDHFHFGFDSVYADVHHLKIVGDTFKIEIRNLSTFETHTKLRVHKLDTDYKITSHQMEFDHLYAMIGDCEVKNYLNFKFNDIGNMAYFLDSVDIELNASQTRLSLQDLSYFNGELKAYDDIAKISGLFKGKVGNFGVRNLKFGFGQRSIFAGKLELKGLPNVQETFVDFAFKESSLFASDIEQYCDRQSFEQFEKFDFFKGKGKFIGFYNDFVASGNIQTKLGNLEADLNFKLDDKQHDHAYYEGQVYTQAFNLGKLLNLEQYVQNISIDGKIEGDGLTLEDAEIKLDAIVPRLELNNYPYTNIKTRATLRNKLFDGYLQVNDTNFKITTEGKVDLRTSREIVKIAGTIEKANLKPLHLSISDKDVLLKTEFYFDFTGLELDKINGYAGLANTYLLYKGIKEVYIDSLKVDTRKNNETRNFDIVSDLLSFEAKGDYNFSTLIADMNRWYKEYSLSFNNNQWEQQTYYSKKTEFTAQPYHVDFTFRAYDINQILSIYIPQIYLSNGFFVKGDLMAGNQHLFNIKSFIDTLYFNENELIKTEIEISTSKSEFQPAVTASAYINSRNQHLKNGLHLKNLFFEGNWKNDSIDFRSSVYQKHFQDYLKLNGSLKLGDRTQTLTLKDSEISLLDKIWKIDPANKIFITKSTYGFENLIISHHNQSMSLDGEISEDTEHESLVRINQFELSNLNSIFKSTKLNGLLNAEFSLKNVLNGIQAIGNLSLDSMEVDGFKIGNIKGASSYDITSNTIKVGLEVHREDLKVIDLMGDIVPPSDSSYGDINLKANLREAELDILNPILYGVLTDIGGKATGTFQITGNSKNISVKGVADVKKGKFKIPYLGTNYFFEDKVYLTENMIGFKKLKLRDSEGNTGIINGGLYHDHFQHFIVNISGKIDKMLLMKLEEKDNKLFYGNAVVSGDFEIKGSFDDLVINAHAISKKGTKIFIPINMNSSAEKQSYIKFVSKKAKIFKTVKKDSVDVSGLKMELNIEITPDAYTEIIFDKRTGDLIRGHGNGNLKLSIDTRGEFGMEGNYQFMEGWYNFTLAGLINKEFKIKPGSDISWTGNPYEGIMNINAEYNQFVSMKPLLKDSTYLKNPEISRKYPAMVNLGLTGNLLTPEIKMNIDILRNPSFMNDVVTAFKAKLSANEQELNRQVFSVLVLGGFAPENSFSGIASPANNLSEMLSNQLSNWLSQVDENLQIDVNLNALDRNALNAFQMRLSYTALDGRLRITRDGGFRNVQNSNQTNLSNIAGEWTIEYLLSNDGKFRLKLYNRINQNILINSSGGGANNSAGFSILHTQNFNSLKDLFSKNADTENKSNTGK
jgi:hypothetical protein